MQLTRRSFTSTVILALAAIGAPFTMFGCGVFSDILSWTNIAGIALDGIVTVLGSFLPPGGALIISGIKATLTDLAGAVVEYENDVTPADKSTTLARIRTFLNDIADNFQNFLSQLNLANNPILGIVLGLAKLILSAIAGFLGQLPVAAGTKAAPVSLHIGNGSPVPVTPHYYKHASDFRNAYNALAVSGGYPGIAIK